MMIKAKPNKTVCMLLIVLLVVCAVACTGIVASALIGKGAESKTASSANGQITAIGASVQLAGNTRTDESGTEYTNDNGIRFSFGIDKTYFNGTFKPNGYCAYVYVVPKWLASAQGGSGEIDINAVKAAEHVKKEKILDEKWKEGGVEGTIYRDYPDMMCAYACLYDIPQQAYGMDICAVAAIEDGSGSIVHTSEVITRSFIYVASEALLDNNVDEDAKGMIAGLFTDNFDYGLTVENTSVNVFSENCDGGNTTARINAYAKNTSLPENAFRFEIDDTSVATVSDDGLVAFIANGTAKVTVTSVLKNFSSQINVHACNYYEIDSTAEFFAINNDLNGYYVLKHDLDFSAEIINGANSSSTDATDWHSIGWGGTAVDYNKSFTGVFDGKGYALKNITVAGAVSSGTHFLGASLFSKVESGAVIKNLSADINVNAGSNNTLGLAGLVGYMTGGTVENCFVRFKTDRTGYGEGGNGGVGAIVGRIDGSTTKKIIRNCVTVFDISNYTGGTVKRIGTIAGYSGSAAILQSLQIENSYGMYLKTDTTITAYKVSGVGAEANHSVAATEANGVFDNTESLLGALNGALNDADAGFNEYWSMRGDGNALYFNNERVLWKSVATAYDYSVKDGGAATVSGVSGTLASVTYNGTAYTDGSSISGEALTLSSDLVIALPLGVSTVDVATDSADYAITFTKATDIIMTPDEFFAINSDLAGYYILGQSIAFTGITVNESEAHKAIGAVAYNDGATGSTPFTGVFDGRGYALTNITIKGNASNQGFCVNLFRNISGATIKNAYFEITISTEINNKTLKESGLIGTSQNNSVIENCYSIVNTDQGSYASGGNVQNPVSAFVSYATNGATTIKNCVGVIQFTDTIRNDTGGYATMIGRINTDSVNIENSYGLVLSKDSAKAAKAYCTSADNSAYTKTPAKNTSEQFTSVNDMLTAMSDTASGMATKGFNGYWNLENNKLYFGSQEVLASA